MLRHVRIGVPDTLIDRHRGGVVADRLESLYPDLSAELCVMAAGSASTSTPASAPTSAASLLERTLLDDEADLIVLAINDIPDRLPDGLQLTTVLARSNPRDAFLSNRFDSPADLLPGARIGTDSLRCQAQLLARCRSRVVHTLTGPLSQALQQLDADQWDALVVSADSLERLDLADRIVGILPIEDCLPGPGQAVTGIASRRDDKRLNRLLARLHDAASETRARAERAFGFHLDRRLSSPSRGSLAECHTPIAAFSILRRGDLWLRAMAASPDGSTLLKAEGSAMPSDAERLGMEVAEQLLQRGADRLLAGLAH